MLKSSTILALSNLSTREDSKLIEKIHIWIGGGGLKKITQQIELSHTILKIKISKLLKEPKLNGIQVRWFLKTAAIPGPVNLGAFRNYNWVGRASLEGSTPQVYGM